MRKMKKNIVGVIGLVLLMSFGPIFNQASASSSDRVTENQLNPQEKYVEIIRTIYHVPVPEFYYEDADGYKGYIYFLRTLSLPSPYPEFKTRAVYGGIVYR
ncbi:hypothetical protein [Sporosarcina limicola]|uniref:Uncharacterized protein n=1 Tax=Sporosarcina limicola TaxID=34101 RepID=A0A927MLD0_9BACL|nr:hypothetical protein [Sporosarcina limicola]MBE1556078.1 hypothetical protein [Sporosarcina limicola]